MSSNVTKCSLRLGCLCVKLPVANQGESLLAKSTLETNAEEHSASLWLTIPCGCLGVEHICPRGPQGPVSALPLCCALPTPLPYVHTRPVSFPSPHSPPPSFWPPGLSAAVSAAGQLWAKGKYLQLGGSPRTAQAYKRLV